MTGASSVLSWRHDTCRCRAVDKGTITQFRLFIESVTVHERIGRDAARVFVSRHERAELEAAYNSHGDESIGGRAIANGTVCIVSPAVVLIREF